MGETALFRVVDTRAGKAEMRWDRGIYVGKTDASNEHMFHTKTGLKKRRAIQRKPEAERWDYEFLESVWARDGGRRRDCRARCEADAHHSGHDSRARPDGGVQQVCRQTRPTHAGVPSTL